jgi:diguanylate cyclase (GGDEF)-like protein/PAS domain S-box-containing protein
MNTLAATTAAPSILYVEDEETISRLVTLVIGREFPDATLLLAQNGREGLELFRTHRPKIVLTDIQMPFMDGISMAREIKEIDRNTRVILISAADDTNSILAAIDIGISHYILKPINMKRLATVLGQCIAAVGQERQLQEQDLIIRRLFRAVEQSPVIVVITDTEGAIEYVNPVFTQVTGYSGDEAVGQKASILKSGEMPAQEYERLWQTIMNGGEWRGEFHNRKKNGEFYWASAAISPITDKEGVTTHFLAFEEDISQRKESEELIRRMAYYDALTGLPNRQLFNEILHHALAQAQRHGHLLAVLFLDLDRFKTVNDTLGHPVGDQLLQAAALRLRECCRRQLDTVARRGGDEFIILLPELSDLQEAGRIAQKIVDAFTRDFDLGPHRVTTTTCVGISIFPHDGDDADTLVRKADMAMYRAKEEGRSRYHLYAPSLDTQTLERISQENSLRHALERGEFLLHYQPKVNIKSGRIVSIEALARWYHPDYGMVPPTQFIPLAEESGLIVPLGEWVLRTACAQNKAWQEAGYPPLRIAVNFSPRQFQQLNLAETVEKILAETGLAPRWLEIEVTENLMLSNEEDTVAALQRLSEIGVHISIDDFGTGYSTFNYIRKLPIDTLKIDRTYVCGIDSNPSDTAIAKAVIDMGQTLKLNVVAEGVETEGQLKSLASLNCPEMQGYLFSRPLPPEEMARLLDDLKQGGEAEES